MAKSWIEVVFRLSPRTFAPSKRVERINLTLRQALSQTVIRTVRITRTQSQELLNELFLGAGGAVTDDTVESAFDELFNVDERTDEEREQEKLEYDRERNESAQASFERTRDRRSDKLNMDSRIRQIAQEQSYYTLKAVGFCAAVYFVGQNYGAVACIALIVAGYIYVWNDERKQKKNPQYMLGQIDELAEDTVVHERIAALASEGKPWLTDYDNGPDNEGAFGYPYWKEVNKKVSLYSSQNQKLRLADNAAARAASLPYRRKALSDIRAQESDADLPYWAQLNMTELQS